MKIRLTTNTYQNFSHLTNVDSSYGFAYFTSATDPDYHNHVNKDMNQNGYGYVIVTPEESFKVKLFEKLSQVLKLNNKSYHYQRHDHFNQIIGQAVSWLNENFDEKTLDKLQVYVKSPSPLNHLLHKALNFFKLEYLGKDIFDAKDTFILPPYQQIVIGTDIENENKVILKNESDDPSDNDDTTIHALKDRKPQDTVLKSTYMTELAQRLGDERFIVYTLLHEFGHHLEFTHQDKYFPTSILAFYQRVLSLNNDSLEDFDKKYHPRNLGNEEEERAFYQQFCIPDAQIIQSLSRVVSETYADVSAVLIERNMLISQNQSQKKNRQPDSDTNIDIDTNTNTHAHLSWKPQDTEDFIEILKVFRQAEMEQMKLKYNRDDVIDMMVHGADFGHLTYGGLDNLAERLKDYGDKMLDEKTLHKIANQCACQNFSRVIYALSNTGVMRPRQIDCLMATQFHWFDNSLVFTGKASEQLQSFRDDIRVSAGYGWCEQFDLRQAKLNCHFMDKADDAIKHELMIDMITDFKAVDLAISQRLDTLNREKQHNALSQIEKMRHLTTTNQGNKPNF